MAVGTLAEARRERWWQDGPPLRSLEEAQEYVEDVGISLLFGGAAARYPSLREASRDASLPHLPSGWGDDLEAMWTWKDTLPVQGHAWLGRYLSGKQTLLSRQLLSDLYEFEGKEDDALSVTGLSEEAGRLAGFLLDEGPTPTRVLREAVGLTGRKFDQLLTELGRRLLITNCGVEEGSGWVSCLIELTARVFPVPSHGSRPERDARATARFLDTMIEAKPAALCRAFGWPRERAAAALQRP